MLKLNRRRGATLLLITHDHELAALADRRIALRDGRVVSDSAAHATGETPDGDGAGSGARGGREATNTEVDDAVLEASARPEQGQR